MNVQDIDRTSHAPDPTPKNRNKRTQITWWDGLAVAMAFAWIFPEIGALASKGTISTRLSPAIEGGLHFADLSSGPQYLFIAALALKFIALLTTVFLVVHSFGDMAKGEVFTEKNSRRLVGGMAGIFVFLFARLGLEGMANNWSSTELGIDWWHDAGTSTPLSDMAPALVLACVLGALATILRRGAQLEEDVEGLV
ncbi:hypothetical protein [Corynebacterium appendicis]|uniref:hypothetical protein n=1 Tax=Corynebacterium appendicis TaxID=163202 RepID=UPI002550C513|nr:hypothetical protein [Corynebacterium appendicis]MDK8626629.1 hypothetical protein [Corynebacterium appendicis]